MLIIFSPVFFSLKNGIVKRTNSRKEIGANQVFLLYKTNDYCSGNWSDMNKIFNLN